MLKDIPVSQVLLPAEVVTEVDTVADRDGTVAIVTVARVEEGMAEEPKNHGVVALKVSSVKIIAEVVEDFRTRDLIGGSLVVVDVEISEGVTEEEVEVILEVVTEEEMVETLEGHEEVVHLEENQGEGSEVRAEEDLEEIEEVDTLDEVCIDGSNFRFLAHMRRSLK